MTENFLCTQVQIRVDIYDPKDLRGLNVSEEFVIGEGIEFIEMCRILGQFHELAEKLKKERAK